MMAQGSLILASYDLVTSLSCSLSKHFLFIIAFNPYGTFRFSGVFPSVNAAIKRRDQALQVCELFFLLEHLSLFSLCSES